MNEIDELKEELKQAQLAYQMAAQMSQFKAGFLARTSHELRSPLSSMIGLHQLILSDLCESPEEQKEFIAQAYHSALKLMKLIDEIVAVSKTEYGSNSLYLESLELSKIFTEIGRLTHLQAANRNLTLEIVAPDPQICVFADRSRLIQLIFNLIDSGIALMKKGVIKLSTTEVTSDSIKIEIDLDCPAVLWQESTVPEPNFQTHDLSEIRELLQEISLSANMKLLMSKTLLETMGGSLELQDFDSLDGSEPSSRIILTCKKAF
ncbi:MAG: HAMP domain-containing histidine kinase [Pleurocapsa sp. SU_5_0]|nr:HAMP domain-containing histidine kinase [Pleurocapsa sp. SU_5_0]NJR45057.1 HAMP domain-containing histidine kinase [Hyellaceae cyanobacterium CSU_1_1]